MTIAGAATFEDEYMARDASLKGHAYFDEPLCFRREPMRETWKPVKSQTVISIEKYNEANLIPDPTPTWARPNYWWMMDETDPDFEPAPAHDRNLFAVGEDFDPSDRGRQISEYSQFDRMILEVCAAGSRGPLFPEPNMGTMPVHRNPEHLARACGIDMVTAIKIRDAMAEIGLGYREVKRLVPTIRQDPAKAFLRLTAWAWTMTGCDGPAFADHDDPGIEPDWDMLAGAVDAPMEEPEEAEDLTPSTAPLFYRPLASQPDEVDKPLLALDRVKDLIKATKKAGTVTRLKKLSSWVLKHHTPMTWRESAKFWRRYEQKMQEVATPDPEAIDAARVIIHRMKVTDKHWGFVAGQLYRLFAEEGPLANMPGFCRKAIWAYWNTWKKKGYRPDPEKWRIERRKKKEPLVIYKKRCPHQEKELA